MSGTVTLIVFLFFQSALSFTHPGLLATTADLNRAQSKIALNLDPWLSSWYSLTNLSYASADYTPNAVSIIYRGDDGEGHAANNELLWHDAAAAFALTLRWKISGDDTYAETASRILTAWGEKLTAIGGNDDAYLASGFQGHELANAAELLRDYAPFSAPGGGLEVFTKMMTSVFLPMNLDFLNHVLGSEHNVKHFFANWELGNLASAMAIAVLTDNTTVWDFAVDYFKNGEGNGCINNAVSNLVEEPETGTVLGQGQEAGRDQGHAALDFQMLGVIGQQAWNQGVDLFGFNDSRILKGAEYFARYNLNNDVPFEPYTNGIVSFTDVSDASRGALRPTWELLYSHYIQLKGLSAPWTTAYLNYSLSTFGGYEPGAGAWGEGSGHYDGLGWGSLLYHLDDSDVPETYNSTAGLTATVISAAASSTVTGGASENVSVSASTTAGLTATVVSAAASSTVTGDASENVSVPASTTAGLTATVVSAAASSTVMGGASENVSVPTSTTATLSSGSSSASATNSVKPSVEAASTLPATMSLTTATAAKAKHTHHGCHQRRRRHHH
ncbi:chondroitin AC/alginate lyase [Pseudomassariella vexata]|uniref:Chondroitin AC/alginate lyase n=1 Tax=Pseudomassariella vexata TaxID=1141098 RepID=A0A1Y2DNR9_9PEZI|nr:chondroitin AC/alginate lyase [Pseudomassariella vexata]ORY60922.1 chondroitin AC/alginate lyase [Pseudomassariella vexata]